MARQRIDASQAKTLADAQIKHIQLFISSGDPDLSLLRSFATNWFAYENGTPFVNRNGRAKWLNKFDPVKHQELLNACHFHSVMANKLIGNSGKKGDLVVDHAIPFTCLRDFLENAPRTSAGVTRCLSDNLRLTVLTKSEDNKLNKMGLRSKMPEGQTSVTARYETAGIVLTG